MRPRKDKLPKSVLAFYVKLYCKKKATQEHEQEKLSTEAIKSWLSLRKTKKQQFQKAFDEYERKLRKKFASKLQNAEPYMKKKPEVVKRLIECPHVKAVKQEIIEDSYSLAAEDEFGQNDIENSFHFDNSNCNRESVTHHDILQPPVPANLFHETNREPDVQLLITEPPPPVRSGRELFEIIKLNEETHLQWHELSKPQKDRYQMAVTSIKRNYIKQYTTYLQQLTSEKLFNHYKTKI